MFGISLSEMLVVALVILVAVGPRRLPSMMRQAGEWIGKARRMTSEVREQTGIDDVLRGEGLAGGLTDLRRMMRGDFSNISEPVVLNSPYEMIEVDASREYPVEGPDSYGVLPDDLVPQSVKNSAEQPTLAPEGTALDHSAQAAQDKATALSDPPETISEFPSPAVPYPASAAAPQLEDA